MALSGGMKDRQRNQMPIIVPQPAGTNKDFGAINQRPIREQYAFGLACCSGGVEHMYHIVGASCPVERRNITPFNLTLKDKVTVGACG